MVFETSFMRSPVQPTSQISLWPTLDQVSIGMSTQGWHLHSLVLSYFLIKENSTLSPPSQVVVGCYYITPQPSLPQTKQPQRFVIPCSKAIDHLFSLVLDSPVSQDNSLMGGTETWVQYSIFSFTGITWRQVITTLTC